jgi:hypothetical protein
MGTFTGDTSSVLFQSLSGFWQRFFRDTEDLEAFYQASETYLSQVYLDLMSNVLATGVVDTPVFNRELWKLWLIDETEINYAKGEDGSEDRYIYDPPGAVMNVNTLQNTIFDPQIVMDKNVEFFMNPDDGIVRFVEDPFRRSLSVGGNYEPQRGVAWRKIQKTVGNRVSDSRMAYLPTSWDWYNEGIRRGDTLRFMGQRGTTVVASGSAGLMAQVAGPTGDYTLTDLTADMARCQVGDMLEITSVVSGNDVEYRGYYVVENAVPNILTLDGAAIPISLPTTSTGIVTWRVYQGVYPKLPIDCEIEYQRGRYLMGPESNPFPYVVQDNSWVYAVIREVPNNLVEGYSLAFATDFIDVPRTFSLPNKHLILGSVSIYAKNLSKDAVVEGTDYTIDYMRGTITQVTPWYIYSNGRCSYRYREEVFYSAGLSVEAFTTGEVTQLSLWAPEVSVDRFTLYYNYGSLINRFAASSETYREYIRGIMALYTSGPVLQRMEAALNVAAGYSVVRSDGETLRGYDSGVTAQGTNAATIASIDSVALPIGLGSYLLTEEDYGGYIVLSGALNTCNIGKFQITGIDTVNNRATVSTKYGLLSELGLDWVLTREDKQVITTSAQVYTLPFGIPVRADISNIASRNVLVLNAFDKLTTVFSVVDYVEDPLWWHNAIIPKELWNIDSAVRRRAVTSLVQHVLDPEDTAKIDDPGLYLDASETEQILPANQPVLRHSAAYVLFDKYLKMHTFKVSIAADVPLLPQFQQDLHSLILIAKPSYTYPMVGTSDIYVDTLELTEEKLELVVGVNLIGATGGHQSDLMVADNALKLDDPAEFCLDDYFKVDSTSLPATLTIHVGEDVTEDSVFTMTLPYDEDHGTFAGIVNVLVPATRGGLPVREGLDYTVGLDTTAVGYGKITILRDWDALSVDLDISYWYVERVNDDGLGTYDFSNPGLNVWNPLTIDGDNPWYYRAGALNPDDTDYQTQLAALRTECIDRPLYIITFVGEEPS